MLKRFGMVLLFALAGLVYILVGREVSLATNDPGRLPLLGYGVELVDVPESDEGIAPNKDRSRL